MRLLTAAVIVTGLTSAPRAQQQYTAQTVHKEFQASNAQLYPRLGDFAVLQFAATSDNGFEEKPVKAGIFNEQWKVP